MSKITRILYSMLRRMFGLGYKISLGRAEQISSRGNVKRTNQWWNTSDRPIGVVWPENKSMLFHIREGEGFDLSPNIKLTDRHLRCRDGRYDRDLE